MCTAKIGIKMKHNKLACGIKKTFSVAGTISLVLALVALAIAVVYIEYNIIYYSFFVHPRPSNLFYSNDDNVFVARFFLFGECFIASVIALRELYEWADKRCPGDPFK